MFTRLIKMEDKVRTKFDVNIQSSTSRTAHNSTSAQPTTQHSTFNTQHSTLNIAKSAIERFYDEQGNETEMVVMKAGSETPGVWIEQGLYHSLEATDEMGVIFEAKAHKYNPETTEQKYKTQS